MKHDIAIQNVANNHGYPFRAVCHTDGCGWKSNTYAAKHAAQSMADDHNVQVQRDYENSYEPSYVQ